MKKTLSKKLQLSRETLCDLGTARLREVAGGGSKTCIQLCGSDANTCFDSCLCGTTLC